MNRPAGVLLSAVLGVLGTGTSQAQTPEITVLDPGKLTAELGSSGVCEDGVFVEQYRFDLDAGDWARVWLRSDDFDSVLTVESAQGETGESVYAYSDDAFYANYHSLIEFQAPATGTYHALVESYAPDVTGTYTVGLSLLDSEGAVPLEGFDVHRGEIAAGGAGAGVGPGASAWIWAEGGERLTVYVSSSDFDTTALLFSPDGTLVSNDDRADVPDDGSGRDLDSTVDFMASVTGLYHLLVLPFDELDDAGEYSLRTESRAPVVLLPGEATPSTPFAGTQTEGRILGLFAGVTHYGPGDELYGCADDASFLAEAFRLRGLQGEADQIVLLDSEATHDALLKAVGDLARTAGPEDVVFLFYSGHGGQRHAEPTDTLELDGWDETLFVYDEEISDNELMDAIDNIEADTVVLALDSCNSGGFARDFLTRPGRVGFFSSEQDILSGTAEVLRAGGFLSYYLRQGVLGLADSKPADGMLTVGELSDYMYEGFVTSHSDINPSGDRYQRIVIDRGSLDHGDTLWLYPRDPEGGPLTIPDVELLSEPETEGPDRPSSCE